MHFKNRKVQAHFQGLPAHFQGLNATLHMSFHGYIHSAIGCPMDSPMTWLRVGPPLVLCHPSIALIAETKSPGFHQYAPKLTQQTYCGQNILPKWSLNSDAVAENQLNNTKNTCKSLCLLFLPAFFNCSNHLPTYKSPPNRGPCRPGCIERVRMLPSQGMPWMGPLMWPFARCLGTKKP